MERWRRALIKNDKEFQELLGATSATRVVGRSTDGATRV